MLYVPTTDAFNVLLKDKIFLRRITPLNYNIKSIKKTIASVHRNLHL
jgi:hypothetical protein